MPTIGPVHIARDWDRYTSKTYFGGIVAFNAGQFQKINGFPNDYWGWGGEDDELKRRVDSVCLKIMYPLKKGIITDLENLSLYKKLEILRAHPHWKCMVKWELAKKHKSTWKSNGLFDLHYSIIEKQTHNVNVQIVKVDIQ